MKTKLLLITFLICSFTDFAFSQEYYPLLNNTTWVVTRMVSCCVPIRIRTISQGSDVVIGDYTYTAFNDGLPQYDSNFNLVYTVYLREDVAERKVYKIVEGVDTLLYDYSMEVGDTITQNGYNWTVTTVDEVETNAGMRKRITLLAPYNFAHNVKQIWIEGIGSNKHPFYPQQNMTAPFMSGSGGVMIYTACVYQNGEHIFGDADCTEMLSTTNEAEASKAISFSPNPFATELTINAPLALHNASFKLYNMQGQLVMAKSNLSGKTMTIARGNLSRGLYLAQLFEKGELVKAEKLMVD